MHEDKLNPPALSQDELLVILDPDHERAEEKYVELYYKLARYFEWNRQPDPEDLAQEALKRGFVRLQQGQKITVDDPAGYFFGIARNLLRERASSRNVEEFEEQHLAQTHRFFYGLDTHEQRVFLRECLEGLPDDDLNLLLAYVEGKIEAWGANAGIPPGAARMRVHRIRRRLEMLVRPRKDQKHLSAR